MSFAFSRFPSLKSRHSLRLIADADLSIFPALCALCARPLCAPTPEPFFNRLGLALVSAQCFTWRSYACSLNVRPQCSHRLLSGSSSAGAGVGVDAGAVFCICFCLCRADDDPERLCVLCPLCFSRFSRFSAAVTCRMYCSCALNCSERTFHFALP